MLSEADALIHAFMSSSLDYCNSVFSGLPNSNTRSLQLVQNAAARLLTGTRKFDHIAPILASLHWLPITSRSDFNVLLLTYKALHGRASSYLKDLIRTVPHGPSDLQQLAFYCYQRLKRSRLDREPSPTGLPSYGIVCHQ